MIEDTLPRILFNGITGRYHIQYVRADGAVTTSSLSWSNLIDAQRIIDKILKTKYPFEVL